MRTAKRENAKRGITGVLFCVDGVFLQVIEGEEENIRQLMRNIESDPRHRDIGYLIDTAVEERGFGQWNMDGFVLKEGTIFNGEVLKDLTESFRVNLVPRSDKLVSYYKFLINHENRLTVSGG